jgi:hypothetical protein
MRREFWIAQLGKQRQQMIVSLELNFGQLLLQLLWWHVR